MKRFLVCAGVSGREKALKWLELLVTRRRPDAILFAGGVLSFPRRFSSFQSTPWGMTQDDALFAETFFERLGKLGTFAAVIPGPEDTPLEEFLRMGMHAEIDFPTVHLAHGTLVEKGNVALSGVGGAIMEESIPEVDYCSRTMAEYQLRSLWTARQPCKILLLPAAPSGNLGGREGSPLLTELIDSYHPRLCVVGGTSACRGAEQVARTLVVNPGYLAEGCAALVDLGRKADEQVELLSRHDIEEPLEIEVGAGD